MITLYLQINIFQLKQLKKGFSQKLMINNGKRRFEHLNTELSGNAH